MNIGCGVPQGSTLGPLLFLIYFNDFKKCLQYSQALNFSDDTVVYVTGKCKDMIKCQLNEDLMLISTYFQTNQLVINLKKGKTNTMLFVIAKRLKKCGKKLTLYYDGIQIPTRETYKYLGTRLDSTLSLSTNFEKMYKKTTAKLCLMYSHRSYLDQHSKIKCFLISTVSKLQLFTGQANLNLIRLLQAAFLTAVFIPNTLFKSFAISLFLSSTSSSDLF